MTTELSIKSLGDLKYELRWGDQTIVCDRYALRQIRNVIDTMLSGRVEAMACALAPATDVEITADMAVNMEIWPHGGGLICHEKCRYDGSCANHSSAGDFRSEGGFTPQVVRRDEKFYCQSKVRPSGPTDVYGDLLPDNAEMLNRGMLIFRDGHIQLSESW